MAIAALKKIEILGHASDRDGVLGFLQRQGTVEVIDLTDRSEEYKHLSFGEQPVRREKVTDAVEKLSWIMSFLEGVSEAKKSALAPKPVLRNQELAGWLRGFDYAALYQRCRGIEASLKKAEKLKLELGSKKKELIPWVRLSLPLASLGETEHTASVLGCVGRKTFPKLRDELHSSPESEIQVVNEDRSCIYILVMYLKEAQEQVMELLRRHEFVPHHLPAYHKPVKQVLEELDAEDQRLESERLAHLEAARTLLSEEMKVAALLDYFSNLDRKELAKQHLLYSDETFYLQGWIRDTDASPAEKKLRAGFDTVEAYLSDPSPDDELPVVLENKGPVRPFEFLTGIYGYPGYQDVDPTPFLAPFFFLFFGYCLGDAIYGLILVLASLFFLKKFPLGPQGKRFFRLFLYCGVSTMVMGALTGGWLGDLSRYLFGTTIPALWVSPQDNPTAVLNVALIIGIISIWTGYAVAAYSNIRRKQYLAVVLDQVPVFVLLAGLTGIGLVFLKTISPEHTNLSLALSGIGCAVLLVTGGRHERSMMDKILFGILGPYTAVTGYLSDILSFSRLWALGLVTAAMASTVNLIGATMGKLIPVVGVVIGVFIIVGGHLLTLAVNTLGAFVHPVRLVFVEFFSKFFRSTGRPFQPLAIENTFTVIEE